MEDKNPIIESLDAFIRKYYKNLLIKGILYSTALTISSFILVALLEHFGYFPSIVRGIIFWLYIIGMLCVLTYFVAVPLLKMNKLGRRISYVQAAKIIGKHFPEVDDKLLNLLQLQNQSSNSDSDLLRASIDQKTSQLKPIPFLNAIDLKSNRKYLKYALPPVILLLIFSIASPTLLIEPSKRIVNYNTYYERPAPFKFVIENPSLCVAQHEDFELRVAIDGEVVPNEVFISIDGGVYKMQNVDKTHFTYLFKNVNSSHHFVLQAADVRSEEYLLTINPKPAITNFQVELVYPQYTGRKSEVVANEGDLTVLEGTSVKWLIQTKDADTLIFDNHAIIPNENGRASYAQRIENPFSYGFYVKNRFTDNVDTLQYNISVVTDGMPMIAVIEMEDSSYSDRLFFHGKIKDDYGFNRLEFVMIRSNVSSSEKADTTLIKIGITKELSQEFYYSLRTDEITLNPGDKLQYFFQVWDNDAIHGSKCAQSQHSEIVIPTEKELENILEHNANEAKDHALNSMSDLKKLQNEINDIMRKMVDKKDLNWQDKKDLQELAKKQQEVKNMLDKMQSQLKENNKLEQKYREQSEHIMEKQRELDRLFNEVMTEEMKEMMKEIDKMLQETDKKKVQEQLENLKINNEDLEKQLDQNLELMRRLEMEKKVENAINKVDKLADKQKQLSQQSEIASGKEKEQLEQQQSQLNQEFNELKKEIKDIQNQYKDIDKNIDFKVDNNLQESIQNKQESASEKLSKSKYKDAAKQQKQAAEEMEKLSAQMAEAQTDIEQQDLAEDAETIRQILKNLVQLSFNQEDLINKVNKIYIQDPQYQTIISSQNIIKSDFVNVEDSLRSIAKRQVAVASSITKELGEINENLSKSLKSLLDMNQSFYGQARNVGSARSMQYTMTSFNNLALILAESLDKMQNQMRQNQQKKNNGNCKNKSMKTKNSCSNPGSGKPSAKSMKQMQDELNKQMQSLKKQLEKDGKSSQNGRKKIGEKGSISEQFAKMAAQQEMIRQMMQEYGQSMKQQDAGNSKLAKEIDEMMRQMEQTETDLVNKTITQQTLKRQQQIMTRLLQHEKAEMEREKEDRRQSHEAQDIYQPSQSEIEEFKKLQEKNIDLFRVTPPTLSPYYKSKVDNYFYKF